MERLTVPAERLPDGGTRIQVVDARLVKEHAMEFYWRLKEYEDTGLSPEDVADLMASHAMAICELAKMPKWIPVVERLPENEVDVLILAERRLYGISETDRRKHHIVATAFHTDGKMNTEDSGYNWELWDTGAEYDEEVDAYIIPEGWWEAVRYGEEFSAVDDIVTHWMPLPKPPKEVAR